MRSGRSLAEYGLVMGLVLVLSLGFAYYVLRRAGFVTPGGFAGVLDEMIRSAGALGFSRSRNVPMAGGFVWMAVESAVGLALLVLGWHLKRRSRDARWLFVGGSALLSAGLIHVVSLLLESSAIVLPPSWFASISGWIVLLVSVAVGFLVGLALDEPRTTEAALAGAACALVLTADILAFSSAGVGASIQGMAGFVLGSVFLGATGGALASVAHGLAMA